MSERGKEKGGGGAEREENLKRVRGNGKGGERGVLDFALRTAGGWGGGDWKGEGGGGLLPLSLLQTPKLGTDTQDDPLSSSSSSSKYKHTGCHQRTGPSYAPSSSQPLRPSFQKSLRRFRLGWKEGKGAKISPPLLADPPPLKYFKWGARDLVIEFFSAF